MYRPCSVFGFTRLNIFSWRFLISLTNSGRINSDSNSLRFYSYFSSSTGLTRVQQSLSWKKHFSNLLILFLSSILSLTPFYSFKAFSRYYFGVIETPCLSSIFKEKSLTIHKKAGKLFIMLSLSNYPLFDFI